MNIIREAQLLDRDSGGAIDKSAQSHRLNTADSFEELFRAEFTPMVRLAHLLGSDDPENAAQEAFSRLHAKMPRLQEPERAVGYLRTCLVNLTRSRHAHLAVVRRRPPTREPDGSSVEYLAMAETERAAVITALGRLSPRQREASVLRYWLDLSEKQMADAIGASVGSVKSHVSRGLSALKSILAEFPTVDDGGIS